MINGNYSGIVERGFFRRISINDNRLYRDKCEMQSILRHEWQHTMYAYSVTHFMAAYLKKYSRKHVNATGPWLQGPGGDKEQDVAKSKAMQDIQRFYHYMVIESKRHDLLLNVWESSSEVYSCPIPKEKKKKQNKISL